MTRRKSVLTTGEIAKICNVAPRTVSKWFDSGQLRGYRIPGSRDRRVPVEHLVRFMRAHHIPLNGLEAGDTRVVLVDRDGELLELMSTVLHEQRGYEVITATNLFSAGMAVAKSKPSVIVVELDLPGLAPRELAQVLRSDTELSGCRLIAVAAAVRENDRRSLSEAGFDAVLAKPFETAQLLDALERLDGPVA